MALTSLFQRIVDEHIHQLFLKNYTEKMIGSAAPAGQFREQLMVGLADAVVAQLWNVSPAEFDVTMTGVLAPREKVAFTFSYRYDPVNIRLQLTGLKAVLNEQYERSLSILRWPHDLPAAGKLHAQLVQEKERSQSRRLSRKLTRRR